MANASLAKLEQGGNHLIALTYIYHLLLAYPVSLLITINKLRCRDKGSS